MHLTKIRTTFETLRQKRPPTSLRLCEKATDCPSFPSKAMDLPALNRFRRRSGFFAATTSWRCFYLCLALFCAANVVGVRAEDDTSDKSQLTRCEGETARFSCPNGTVISIEIANYGRFSITPCNPDGDTSFSTVCQNLETVNILRQRCDNRESCALNATNELFGDACPETSKYLEVIYTCVPPTTTTTTTTTTPMPTTTTTTPAPVLPKDESVAIEDALNNGGAVYTPKFCPAVYERHISWPKTEGGRLARMKCPVGTTGDAEWMCSVAGTWDPKSGADLSRCVSDWSYKLQTDVETKPNNAVTQIETLKEIHSRSRREQLIGGDLLRIQNIVKKIVLNYAHIMETAVVSAETHQRSFKMNKYFVETVNHLLSSNQNGAWNDLAPVHQRELASSLLRSMERLLAAIFPVSTFTSPDASAETFVAKPNVMAEASTVNLHRYVAFPAAPLNFDVAKVPREALEFNGGVSAQVVFTNIDGMHRLLAPKLRLGEDEARRLVSRVLSVTMVRGGVPQSVQRVTQPVVLSFRTEVTPDLANPQCVWWDFDEQDWSTNGCRLHSHNGSHTVCECNHLTHFAVLMDVRGLELPRMHDFVLTVVTYVGCTLSIVCLVIAFFCFSLFGDTTCDRVMIHKNLVFCLAVGEIVFLLGIHQTDNRLSCSIVAAVLLYFFLSAFVWMLLEGFQLYYLLVRVFDSKHSRRPLFYLLGYGLPLAVLGAAFYFNPDGFGTSRHCWLSTRNFFVLWFVAPVAAVIFCNLMFLLMTLCIVCRHSNIGYKPCRHDSDTIKTVRAWCKGSFALLFLLGLTWSTGFFWIDHQTVWVAYIFTFFNSLQGFFILLSHVLMNDKMHKDYTNWVRRNDWLPDCLRGHSLGGNECRTGPYLPSTATSSANSSHGSDGTFPGQQWTLDRFAGQKMGGSHGVYNASMKEAMSNYHGGHPNEECYEYATIPYDDPAQRGRVPPSNYSGSGFRSPYGTEPYPSSNGTFHSARGPPSFKPPPPPSCAVGLPAQHVVSDDSAYSDSGASSSRSPHSNAGGMVSRSGTLVYRIDLTQNPPVFCEGV